jgi:hypothetical protein
MKNLMYKELKLVIHPAIYVISLLTALLLAPFYPYSVVMAFFIHGVEVAFGSARANRDLEFTATLPVSRNAIVLSKHFLLVFLQLLHIFVAVPFALLSSLLIYPAGNIVGFDACFAFFGVTFIGYSVFNIIFLPGFFKSGYKWGFPGLLGGLAYGLTVAVFEIAIAFVPVLKSNLDSLNPGTFIYQIPVLLAGIAIYVGSLCLSYRLSVKNFARVSL